MSEKKLAFFDHPQNIKLVLYILYSCCTVLFVLDFIVHRHKVHPWEGLLGFHAVYGFVGCVVLVVIAKWMRTFLMRDEDFYTSEELDMNENSGGDHVGR